MSEKPDPIQLADDTARTLARALLRQADHAALSFRDPADGLPGISRIAFGLTQDGVPITLVSSLAAHVPALRAEPACAIMVAETAEKGDPLTHARLMIKARAEFVAQDAPDRAALRDDWLRGHPKSKLYIDFADFCFVRFRPTAVLLNAGFGKAFRLQCTDLTG